ncbi:DedA family protein [Paenibacillus sp. P26]|nr:DedA family protein [Paenibacillus sp. P26]
MEWISSLFEQYGYYVLFLGLFAESLALPFPGELAMAISGHMSTLGSFHFPLIVLYSYLGAIIGTTVTYYLGYKLGIPFFEKYGRYFFMNQERIAKMMKWFERYGDKLILVSYFVPGPRHFTGYVSGILKVRLRTFFLYNYVGGLVWVLVYAMIGKLFGYRIEQLLHLISRYSAALVIVAAVIIVAVLVFKQKKAAVPNRSRGTAD